MIRRPAHDPSTGPVARQRLIYGRRAGHRLRPGLARLLEEELPGIRVELREHDRIATEALFGGPRPLWLEIGFGAGEHLAALAERHPEVGFIGCEPFQTGVAKLLARRERAGLENLRIVVDDARLLLDALPDQALERIYVLFPDPWPKTRHHKRRIVNPATARAFVRLLRPGGEVRLATDDMGYVRAMLEAMLRPKELEWTAGRAADWRERPADEPMTRYEAKALAAGRRCCYLRFRRRWPESP
ncbi:MAG TPA: tRNA (guanosine(46)-N7)-methyltransferase TrmB [Geminicoccaceae bacterium]